MSKNNFGAGSRNMCVAGRFVINKTTESFSSKATKYQRWKKFCQWARNAGIRWLEDLRRDDVIRYGHYLYELILSGDIEIATAHNYISAVNTVLSYVHGNHASCVSAVNDCGIPKRSGITTVDKSMPLERHQALQSQIEPRVFILMCLQRALGLRFEESSKLNASKALSEAENIGIINVIHGTKGGRKRQIPVLDLQQLETLKLAAKFQGKARSMIPSDTSYISFHDECYRAATENGFKFHSERHAYAINRYQQLTGLPCPVVAGIKHGKPHIQFLKQELDIDFDKAKAIDQSARQIIAEELGHHRARSTNAYLG